jgi:hypothetical protein
MEYQPERSKNTLVLALPGSQTQWAELLSFVSQLTQWLL